MMMNRDKLGFWARFIAIGLAVVFIASFVFMGIGSNVTYNIFELIGGGNEQSQQQNGSEQQIQAAEDELENRPNDPEAIKSVASLYLLNGQLEDAERVLENSLETVRGDTDIHALLGQVYSQQALSAGEGRQEELQRMAGEQYVAATEIDSQNEEAFLLAGQAYEEAGDPGRAIQYYNGYLDLEPDGEQSQAVEERITTLLEEPGEEGAAGGQGGEGAGEGQPEVGGSN